MSHIEQELESTWQEKLDRMLASANDRHQRALGDLQEEKTSLEAKVKDMQEKVSERVKTMPFSFNNETYNYVTKD